MFTIYSGFYTGGEAIYTPSTPFSLSPHLLHFSSSPVFFFSSISLDHPLISVVSSFFPWHFISYSFIFFLLVFLSLMYIFPLPILLSRFWFSFHVPDILFLCLSLSFLNSFISFIYYLLSSCFSCFFSHF